MNTTRIFWAFVAVAIKRLTYFRSNLVFMSLYWGVSISVLLIFWKVVFINRTEIAGWTLGELCFLNAIAYVSWGLFVLLWGFRTVPEKVRNGSLDKYLVRPTHPLVSIIGEEIHLTGLYEIGVGVVIATACKSYFGLHAEWSQILLGGIALLLGTVLILLMHGCISMLSFWLGRVSALQNIADQLDDYQRYPIQIFEKSLQGAFMTIAPIYFAGTLAASLMLGKPIPVWTFGVLLCVLFAWITLFALLFKHSLRRYESSN